VYTGGETEVDHQNPSRYLEGDLSNEMLGTVSLYPTGSVGITAEKMTEGRRTRFSSNPT